MKKLILYAVIIGATFFAPRERADIARLEPIEAIGIFEKDGQIRVKTDTEAEGAGESIEQALCDLKESTPGIVYLDTAEYLLVSKSAINEIRWLKNTLKGTVKLCLWDADADLSDAVKYLSVHGELPMLKRWSEGVQLPEYVCEKIS